MTDTAYRLPVFDTIKTAWAKVKGSKGTFWSFLGIIFLLGFCRGILMQIFEGPNGQLPLWVNLFGIVVFVLNLLLLWGLYYIGIQRAADRPIEFSLVKYVFSRRLLFRLVGLYILQLLIVIAISFLLVLPFLLSGIHQYTSNDLGAGTALAAIVYIVWLVLSFYLLYFLFRLYLAKALVLANQMGPLTALKASYVATKGNVWRLMGITLLSMLIVLVSIVPFGIGMIWSLPFVFINYGEVFRRLVSER